MKMLEKARSYKTVVKIPISVEEIEVALAWLTDNITPTQAAYGLGLKLVSGNYQRHLARILKEAYKRGKLVINATF